MRCDNCGWSNPDGVSRCQKCNQELAPSPVESQEINVPAPDVAPTPEVVQEPVDEGKEMQCPKCHYPMMSSDICPNCGYKVGDEQEETAPKQTAHKEIDPDLRKTVIRVDVEPETEPEKPADEPVVVPVAKPNPNPLNKTVIVSAGDINKMKQTMREVPNDDLMPKSNVVKETVIEEVKEADEFSLVAIDAQSAELNFKGETMLNRANVDSQNLALSESEQALITCNNGEWYIENRSDLKNTYICVSRKTKLEKGDIIVIGGKRYIFQ